jgi:ribonuclease HII
VSPSLSGLKSPGKDVKVAASACACSNFQTAIWFSKPHVIEVATVPGTVGFAEGSLPRLGALCYAIKMPSLEIELAAGGRVAGVDEAGRGPLAGPVVAAAVVLGSWISLDLANQLDDSKKLSPQQRLKAFKALRQSRAEIGVGAASVAEILDLNILQASMLAMRRAVARLGLSPDLALVDGNYPPSLPCSVKCVVGGDGVCLSIAAASIVAKVVRDHAMTRLAARWPGYGWETNAGYATPFHRAALRQLGATRHHRDAFGTVAALRFKPAIAD